MKHPEFAKRFKEAVSIAGVSDTQKSLSKLLGVSEVMIWSYRNGEKLPRMSTAVRISEKLGVSVVWLLQGEQQITASRAEINEESLVYQAKPPTKPMSEILRLCEQLSTVNQKKALALLTELFPNK